MIFIQLVLSDLTMDGEIYINNINLRYMHCGYVAYEPPNKLLALWKDLKRE